VDIPFIRFAFPLLILYGYWHAFVTNPWVDPPQEERSGAPNYLSETATREILDQGRKLLAQNKFEESLGPFRRLHATFPDNHIYLESLARAYERLERYKEADEMWEQYLQYSPTPIEACPQIGLDYRAQGRPDEALKAFERCHAIEENPDTLLFYANALEREGQFRRALELYERALERAPNYTDVAVGLARVEARTGKASLGRPRIEDILKNKPNDVDALQTAGIVYSELGKRAMALRYLERAHKLAPDDNEINLLLRTIRREKSSQ